jgi:type III secretory pathway component EscS
MFSLRDFVFEAVRLIFVGAVPIAIVATFGGVLASAFLAACSLQDRSGGYFFRLAGVVLLGYFFVPTIVALLLRFTERALTGTGGI